jgi:superfamily II DNA or RNA helicase
MYGGLVSLFPARVRVGLSATPDKTGDFLVAESILGDVFHEVPYEDLEELGIIVKPHVEVVETSFEFTYWPDHRVERNKKTGKVPPCEVPNCPKAGKPHGHRNNYQKLKAAVVEDPQRSAIIADKVIELSGQGHHQLVVSDQTGHLDTIGTHLLDRGFADKIFQLTGKLKGSRREQMIAEIEASAECVILSTIAGEALDIPAIDVVHLVFPTRNAKKTEQNIGRGSRTHDGKVKSVIYDYADFNVNVLAGQFGSRLRGCYRPLELEVKGLKQKKKAGGLGKLGVLG